MSMIEYDAKFLELSHYVEDFIQDKCRCTRHFMNGLRPDIYQVVKP